MNDNEEIDATDVDRAERVLSGGGAIPMPLVYWGYIVAMALDCSGEKGIRLAQAVLDRQAKRPKAPGDVTYGDIVRSTDPPAWRMPKW